MRGLIFTAAIVTLACGQTVHPSDAGPDGSVDAGWTQCSSPDGYRACGETVSCPPCGDDRCNDVVARVGLCDGLPDIQLIKHPCYGGARDGEVCVAWDDQSGAFYSVPATIGRLLAQNGAKARVRFGDLSEYQLGVEMPSTAVCPIWTTAQPCGATCGSCPPGSECVGRGPLHPVGFCKLIEDTGCKSMTGVDGGLARTCSDAGKSCLTMVVQPAVQPDADYWGACIATPMCDELAAKLSGGARCSR